LVGRWLNEDPIGYKAKDTNLYRYVGNRSLTAIDPFGKEVTPTQGQIDYARSKCKCACASIAMLIDDYLEQNAANMTAIMADANVEAFKYTKGGKAHSALRHCIGSGLLAAKYGCDCSQCISDTREDYQLNRREQSQAWTDATKANNKSGRVAAGCGGSKATEDPTIPPSIFDIDRPRRPIYDYNSRDNIISSCVEAMKNGDLSVR